MTTIPYSHAAAVRARRASTPIPSVVIAMLIFLGTEVMLFVGLVSAYLVLRAGVLEWPPSDQPRLPVLATGLNTLVLMASAVTVRAATLDVRGGGSGVRPLAVTAALGAVFLGVQGWEWARMIGYGLTTSSGLYGSTFYTLVGVHAVHAFLGLGVLLFVLARAVRGSYSATANDGIVAARMYWTFVVGVWPILYVLVYLA